jgi:hypothetical protein
MNWIPALSTTGLLAVALWLARNVIITRLTRSVQHEFDVHLEGIRTQLRNSEETFKAELRQRDDAIAAARSASLSALTASRGVFDKRRIDAVDEVLRAIAVLATGKWAVTKISIYNMSEVSARIENEPKLIQLFTLTSPNHQKLMDDLKLAIALSARPYISELTWALFSAYQSVIVFCASLISLLQQGIAPMRFVDLKKMSAIVRGALGDQWGSWVDASGFSGYPQVLEELEGRLFEALRFDAEGHASDAKTVERAAQITKASREMMQGIDRARAETVAPDLVVAPHDSPPGPNSTQTPGK